MTYRRDGLKCDPELRREVIVESNEVRSGFDFSHLRRGELRAALPLPASVIARRVLAESESVSAPLVLSACDPLQIDEAVVGFGSVDVINLMPDGDGKHEGSSNKGVDSFGVPLTRRILQHDHRVAAVLDMRGHHFVDAQAPNTAKRADRVAIFPLRKFAPSFFWGILRAHSGINLSGAMRTEATTSRPHYFTTNGGALCPA